MLAKLLSLLIHAKAGAISGVFLLGATGALVSVSAQNGVTTITFTDPSPTPAATTSPTPTPSPAASPQLSSPSTSPACSDEAKALALQVQLVDTAFSGLHTDLTKLKGQRDEKVLETADHTLKSIRSAAVRAIHATATAPCLKKDDDEDKNDATDVDTDVDKDDQHGDNTNVDEDKNDEDNGKTAGPTFTGAATSIADQAIRAMQTAFATAQNSPVTTSTTKNESNKSPKVSPTKGPDKKGDHHD